jgi:transposase
MLYLGIDLHGKQITVCIRDEHGDVVLRRQVSTRWEKVRAFFRGVRKSSGGEEFVVLLEVCGFHDWLVKLLQEDEACRDIVLIQPEKRSKQKTDRRDANRLSELLWVNRQRLMAGQSVHGVRRVYIATDEERQNRQLTSARQRLGKQRTRTINQIRHILRRNNLEWDRPTKTFQTKKVKQWLKTLSLEEIDRLEMDHLLQQWETWERQIKELAERIEKRFETNEDAKLLSTTVGVNSYMGLAIACRIGPIDRFPRARSLANFFGLTPGSRSSGETERLGSITKEGSRIVRFLLGQLVLHVLRRDARMRTWYQRIKKRRGAKIARVAVMRRLWRDHLAHAEQAGSVPIRRQAGADTAALGRPGGLPGGGSRGGARGVSRGTADGRLLPGEYRFLFSVFRLGGQRDGRSELRVGAATRLDGRRAVPAAVRADERAWRSTARAVSGARFVEWSKPFVLGELTIGPLPVFWVRFARQRLGALGRGA